MDLKSRLVKVAVGIIGIATTAVLLLQLMPDNWNDAPGPLVTGTLQTQRGEHRCEVLPDQTRACLNTNSVLRYTYSQHARNLELVSGEVLLTVNSADNRPLSALSGSFLTRDVSTEFDLRKKSGSTVMTVTEGAVRVASAPMSSELREAFNQGSADPASKAKHGYHRLDQVEFDESTRTLYQHPALTEERLSQLLAWQRGRIDLNGLSLGDALAEFSRYERIDTVKFTDPALRNLPVGGEMDSAGGFRDFVHALPAVYKVRCTIKTTADGYTTVTLSHRRPQGS